MLKAIVLICSTSITNPSQCTPDTADERVAVGTTNMPMECFQYGFGALASMEGRYDPKTQYLKATCQRA